MKTRILAVVLAVGCSVSTAGQEPSSDDGAWTLTIATSGGFTGQGAGQYVLTSRGRVSCTSPARCPDRLTDTQLRELTDLIESATKATWGKHVDGRCADCYRIQLRLQRRERGEIRNYEAEWDEPLGKSSEIARLYRVVARLSNSQ